MKRSALAVVFLALLSLLSGYLMSKPSLIGRIGIEFFYKQYRFLRVWWQGALAVFVTLLVLFLLQGWIQRKCSTTVARIVHVLMIALAIAGLYFTYYDFQHTITHRWLRERFHIGAYLFWLGWIGISIFYLYETKRRHIDVPDQEETA